MDDTTLAPWILGFLSCSRTESFFPELRRVNWFWARRRHPGQCLGVDNGVRADQPPAQPSSGICSFGWGQSDAEGLAMTLVLQPKASRSRAPGYILPIQGTFN